MMVHVVGGNKTYTKHTDTSMLIPRHVVAQFNLGSDVEAILHTWLQSLISGQTWLHSSILGVTLMQSFTISTREGRKIHIRK